MTMRGRGVSRPICCTEITREEGTAARCVEVLASRGALVGEERACSLSLRCRADGLEVGVAERARARPLTDEERCKLAEDVSSGRFGVLETLGITGGDAGASVGDILGGTAERAGGVGSAGWEVGEIAKSASAPRS